MSKIVATLTADIDYLQGHLRYGHYEASLTEEQLNEYNALSSDEEKIEYIKEVGEVIVDDYSLNDYGDVSVPEVSVHKQVDYKGRVIAERDEVNERHEKLVTFIEVSTSYAMLPEVEREDLQDQADYMEAYIAVLNRRIERF